MSHAAQGTGLSSCMSLISKGLGKVFQLVNHVQMMSKFRLLDMCSVVFLLNTSKAETLSLQQADSSAYESSSQPTGTTRIDR